MKERDFAFWLQGFFEMTDAKQLDEKQTQMVKDHLFLVFEHVAGKSEEETNIDRKPHTVRNPFDPFKPRSNRDLTRVYC